MSPDHVSILIIIIFVIFLISIVKYHEHYQGYQLLQNPFQAEGCENLKRNSHLDCKCIRNSKGEINGQNQCTYNVNCSRSYVLYVRILLIVIHCMYYMYMYC